MPLISPQAYACDLPKTQDGKDVCAKCNGWVAFKGEAELQDAVATIGVIAIAVDASTAFQRYS